MEKNYLVRLAMLLVVLVGSQVTAAHTNANIAVGNANAVGDTITYEDDDFTYELVPAKLTAVVSGKSGKNYTGELVLPKTVTYDGNIYVVNEIKDEGFAYQDGITKVNVCSPITKIGMSAFAQCTALEDLTLGQGITSIGMSPFLKTKVKHIYIPEGVTSIEGTLFTGLDELETVTIPRSANRLWHTLFALSPKLHTITIKAFAPATEKDWNNTFILLEKGNVTLRIPKGSTAAFLQNEDYQGFKEIVEVDFDAEDAQAGNGLSGDVNNDGKIDANDVSILVNQILSE